jgi:hypothetical protein
MSKQDGGPAFPNTLKVTNEEYAELRGMSLRAYFAGQAMAGMVAGSRGLDITTAQFAKQSVVLADALIAALKEDGE